MFGAAIGAAIAWLEANGPAIINLGISLAPAVSLARASLDRLRDTEEYDQGTFDALDVRLKPFEDDLQKLGAEAQARQDGGSA